MINRTKTLLLMLLNLIIVISAGAQEAEIIRRPVFNPSGNKIAFSWQGDIWTVPAEGGRAIRLTIHEAYESNPVWSPDGKMIAFTGNRFGNRDIFRITAQGSNVKRLTFHSAEDYLYDWTVNDRLLFSTSRNFRQVEWDHEIHTVSANGGTPYRLLDAVGEMPVMSPDGKYIAFVRGACRVAREKYKGAANKDIWLYDIEKDEYKQITTYNGQDYLPKWKDNETIGFISARNGKYNIFSVNISDTSLKKQITGFKDFGVRYFSTAEEKKKLVFSRKDGIYVSGYDGQNKYKVKVEVSKDNRFDNREYKTYTNEANNFDISPNGKYNAFVIRGDIFVTRNDEEDNLTNNITRSPARDRNPVWLNDTTLIYISDRNGQYDIFLARSDNRNETNLLKSLQIKNIEITHTPSKEFNLSLSPDSKKLAFVRGQGSLIVADISAKGEISNQRQLRTGWAEPEGIAWSPDNNWLAYSIDNLNFNSEVFIQNIDHGEPINISMHPRADYSPVWSRDGSKLGFVSERHNQDRDIWFVWLQKENWLKTDREWKEEEITESEISKEEEGEEKKVEAVEIDTEEIYKRIERVTNYSGDEIMPLFSEDGETIYFTAPSKVADGRDLFSIKWNGDDLQQITKGGRSPGKLILGNKGNTIFMLGKGKLSQIQIEKEKFEPIAFLAEMEINYQKEIEQIFNEGWRTIYNGFYDPDFHGRDWKELKNKYKELVLKASTKEDMAYIFNLMLGQLNSSHMGLYSSGRHETQEDETGRIGAAIIPVEEGLKIERIIPQTPAARQKSKLYKDDIILSVNGKKNTSDNNFYAMLNKKVEKRVLLKVRGEDGIRDVYIWPSSNIRSELYKEWVARRRELTDKFSKGKLGYLHIQGMNWTSFEQFERDLAAAGYNKDGIVIDVRYNGGGWTTDYLMAILNVEQHAYTIPRGAADDLQKEHEKFRNNYPFAERLPFYPWTKPSIALCNSNSYSNAEIFSHAYKTLDIGTLVGEPTFGAVISTGGKRLIDGSYIRLPYRAWYVKKTNQNMEKKPAVPDIIIENPPGSKAENRDSQLRKAVNQLLKEIPGSD